MGDWNSKKPNREAKRSSSSSSSDLSDEQFEDQLERTLKETEEAVLEVTGARDGTDEAFAWHASRHVVEEFKPVPWFIWRLCNFVLGKSGQIGEITEGMVFGLRKLLFAAASDPSIGAGGNVSSMRQALQILPSDVVASVGVIHAICRRLSKKPHERIWRPLLDDALLRARIGVEIGLQRPQFGPGRTMLAGFAGRCGLSILISSGDLDQARKSLELLATGLGIQDVGLKVYKCDPLQISAMTLSACGCGRDAAFGTASFASENPQNVVQNDEQMCWLAAFSITEYVRRGKPEGIDPKFWEILGYTNQADIDGIFVGTKKVVRRGHGWDWIV